MRHVAPVERLGRVLRLWVQVEARTELDESPAVCHGGGFPFLYRVVRWGR